MFDPERFAYSAARAYTPPTADVRQLADFHRALHVSRTVLVQPSVYGMDNSCMLHALRAIGPDRARGIAVVDLSSTPETELHVLHEAGVRGVRLNLRVSEAGIEQAKQALSSTAVLRRFPGWHVQLHASLDILVDLLEDLRRLELPVVLDHFAGGLFPDPSSEDALTMLLRELRRGQLYVKLSAPYRLWSGDGTSHATRLAREFQAAAPDRVLWGSDWPHTGGSGSRTGTQGRVEAFRTVDDRQVLQELLATFPREDAREPLLVRNPAALYGFDS